MRWAYFRRFPFSDSFAAPPSAVVAAARFVWTYELTHVASHNILVSVGEGEESHPEYFQSLSWILCSRTADTLAESNAPLMSFRAKVFRVVRH